jgi:hypothetical protein
LLADGRFVPPALQFSLRDLAEAFLVCGAYKASAEAVQTLGISATIMMNRAGSAYL